jgi:hypothetical protein
MTHKEGYVRKYVVPLVLALTLLISGASRVSAHPSHPARPLSSCTWTQEVGNSAFASGSDSFSGGFFGQVWIQEQFYGGTSCLVFQPVGRIQSSYYFSQEPIWYWQIRLMRSDGVDLGTYTWSTAQNTPGYTDNGQGWWYFYGPDVQLSCATGQIYATELIFESSAGSATEYFNTHDTELSEGDYLSLSTSTMWTC